MQCSRATFAKTEKIMEKPCRPAEVGHIAFTDFSDVPRYEESEAGMKGSSLRPQVVELLDLARQGERAARDRVLSLYRPYLRLVVGRKLPKLVSRRIDGSDIVQHTLMDAERGLSDFRGATEPELTAWMITLLERNLLQCIRSNTAEKRDVRREARELGDGSAELIWHGISCDGSTPESNVFRGEAALLLAQALEQLPEAQRMALERRFLGQQSLKAIAEEMQRTESSVAGLIRRGLAAIQAFLPAELGELSA